MASERERLQGWLDGTFQYARYRGRAPDGVPQMRTDLEALIRGFADWKDEAEALKGKLDVAQIAYTKASTALLAAPQARETGVSGRRCVGGECDWHRAYIVQEGVLRECQERCRKLYAEQDAASALSGQGWRGDEINRMADAIDAARYAHPDHPRDRPRPFAEADRGDREYAFRLARAAFAILPAPPGERS